jgi:hypothetical protein
MLTNEYLYQSDSLQHDFIDGNLDKATYLNLVEQMIGKELNKASGYFRQNKEELYTFERQQFQQALLVITQNHQQEEEFDRISGLSPEQKLYEERERYYKYEVPKLIEEYRQESEKYRDTHNKFQWIIIIGSAIVTSCTSITIFTETSTISYIIKVTAAMFSLAVTIVAGFTGYFKYRERSTNLQKTADDIEHEFNAIKLGTHIYLGKQRDEAIGLFCDRVIKRIKEQKEQQQTLEQPSENKPIQTPG